MRTAILFGAMIIADSINKENLSFSDYTIKFIAIVILVCMCMDIVDFFRNKK